MKKTGLLLLIGTLLVAGCSVNKKLTDTNLRLGNYGTKESSSRKFSHSIWIEYLNLGDEKLVEVNSDALYEMVFIARGDSIDSFVYMDLPNKNHPDSVSNATIENLSLFIGKKNRTWQAEVYYGAMSEDSNFTLLEFVDHNKQYGVITLDFDKKKYLIQYSSNSEKEEGDFSKLEILFVDPMFTNNP
jgi:hypothetical protein